MQNRSKRIISATLCLTSLISFPMLAMAQETTEQQIQNAKPSELLLQRIDDGAALIKARFPTQKPGGWVEVIVGEKRVLLSDTGENGDQKGGDGLFSVVTEFDFEAFAETSRQFAERNDRRDRPLFSAVGRQLVGTQTTMVEGDTLVLVEDRPKQEVQQFALPLDSNRIEFGQDIRLPVHGLPLAVPVDADIDIAAAPTSIPHSLMITDLSVVNDPDRTWACAGGGQAPTGDPHGEWTFWTLMENIANGTSSTSDYIKQLFDHWNSLQIINNDSVPARPNVFNRVIRDWEIRSGGVGAPLLPQESPFRLLGIMPRLDLRGGGSAYGGGDAGEGRFVFSLHDGNCNTMAKTIILEYKVPLAGCFDVRSWAQRWKALATSSNYNSDLAALTQVFSAAGANPLGPNQSAISQVRTNELLPGSPGWELREFVLRRGGGFLSQTTVKQEPQTHLNNSVPLADYVNLHWPALLAGTHEIPLNFSGTDFLAGHAPAPVLWNVPNSMLTVPLNPSTPVPATDRDNALFELAVNTCSGCHVVETGTPFAHLDYNTPPGQPAILSGFLTGITLPDPRNAAIPRQFNDLARRANDMDDVAAMACRPPHVISLGNALLHELSAPSALQAVH